MAASLSLTALIYYPLILAIMVFLFIGVFSKADGRFFTKTWFNVFFIIIEILVVAVLPGSGIAMHQDKCGEHPFSLHDTITTYICWLIPTLAYFISRYTKKVLPPLIIFLMSSAISFGFIFCVITTIHFVKFLPAVAFPFFGAQIISPFLCIFLLGRELGAYKTFYETHLQKQAAHTNGINRFIASVLASGFLKRYAAIAGITLPFVVALQGILFLTGQAPDSIIRQFTESCGFLLSNYQDCSCPGDHYLCSVAAFGKKELVKPTRTGLRGGKIILVNRQLLIANAFENWFEEHTPRIAKLMRRTYDACNIPADKWAKNKFIANTFYILMKPAEWIFLFWLYLFDKHPETRIARQYLPKEKLEKFTHHQSI